MHNAVLTAHHKFGRYWIYKGTPVRVLEKRGVCFVVEAMASNGVAGKMELIIANIIPRAIQIYQRKAA